MSAREQDEEILQLNLSQADLEFVDNTSSVRNLSEGDSSDNIALKFMTKGSVIIDNLYSVIAEYLWSKINTNIVGCYIRNKNDVLYEVTSNQPVLDWLVLLFEERQNTPMKDDKKMNILKLVDGKFQLVLGGKIVFLIVLPNTKSLNLSCRTNVPKYGLANGEIMNLFVGCFKHGSRSAMKQVFECFVKHGNLRKKMIGCRIEPHENIPHAYKARLIIKYTEINDKFLSRLDKYFGSVQFTSSTFHLLPMQISDDDISNVQRYDLALLHSNDVYATNGAKFEGRKSKKNNDKRGKLKININTLNLHIHENGGNSVISRNSNSIFDRLGPKCWKERDSGTSFHRNRGNAVNHRARNGNRNV